MKRSSGSLSPLASPRKRSTEHTCFVPALDLGAEEAKDQLMFAEEEQEMELAPSPSLQSIAQCSLAGPRRPLFRNRTQSDSQAGAQPEKPGVLCACIAWRRDCDLIGLLCLCVRSSLGRNPLVITEKIQTRNLRASKSPVFCWPWSSCCAPCSPRSSHVLNLSRSPRCWP